jgi:hypothetical protein
VSDGFLSSGERQSRLSGAALQAVLRRRVPAGAVTRSQLAWNVDAMNDRLLSRARPGRKPIVLDAPADAAVRQRLFPAPTPYAEVRPPGPQRFDRTSGWSLVRILCAVAVVVAVQILICLDGGIVFDLAARPILGFDGHYLAQPGLSAIALDAVSRPTAHRATAFASFAGGQVRPAVLIRVTDSGPGDAAQTADHATRHAMAKARPAVALPETVIPTDGAMTTDAAMPSATENASRKAAEVLRKPPERIMRTPLDRLGSNERQAVLLGLVLLSASDPRLRFGY